MDRTSYTRSDASVSAREDEQTLMARDRRAPDVSCLNMSQQDVRVFTKESIQKVYTFQVNEQGTEAAAATAVHMIALCSMVMSSKPKLKFIADHPFLFSIVDQESLSLLFFGRFAGQ